MITSFVDRPALGLFIIRLMLAVAFFMHAYVKFSNFAGAEAFFTSLSLPTFLVYVVTVVEFLAALSLLVGMYVRVAAAALVLDMLGALYFARLSAGYLGGFELELLLLAVSLGLVFTGGGMVSLWILIKKNQRAVIHNPVQSEPIHRIN